MSLKYKHPAGSYGSLARFRDVERIKQFGDYTIIGASGDLSDYQKITSQISELK